MISIALPLPPKHCWPNARSRSHWPATNDKKKARRWAHDATLEFRSQFPKTDKLTLQIRYYPKPRCKAHDGDNINAAAKAYIDGIASAMGFDDAGFTVPAPIIESERKAMFVIEVTW